MIRQNHYRTPYSDRLIAVIIHSIDPAIVKTK